MTNLFNLSQEEKNRIRGLHLNESNDKRITSLLNEQSSTAAEAAIKAGDIKPICVRVDFSSGEAELGSVYDALSDGGVMNKMRDLRLIQILMTHGMESDRPFMDIEAGTSGTGSHGRNREVMDKRINEAIDFILREMEQSQRGRNKLRYSTPAVIDKANIDRKYSRIEPGSILPDGTQVPTDPNHPYFMDFQYVNICFNPPSETPGYGSLADQFMAATIEKIGGTDDRLVYSILDTLRDGEDFREFNEELKRDYGMDFYEVACDSTMWIKELGSGDTTINAHLKRLGAQPIPC